MKMEDFRRILCDALNNGKMIIHVLESDNSILVACNDQSNFFINIIESKRTFIHDNKMNEFTEEYLSTHTDEEFAKDILGMVIKYPEFFCYFMIFNKLEEMHIIDTGLFYHIMDSIIGNKEEFDEFIGKLLNCYL